MKGLIIFGLLSMCLVGVYSGKVTEKCTKETGLNVGMYNDKKYGCFIACILKEEGAMKNGVIDVNHKILLQHPRRKECANLRGKDDCDTAKKYDDCIENLYKEEFIKEFHIWSFL